MYFPFHQFHLRALPYVFPISTISIQGKTWLTIIDRSLGERSEFLFTSTSQRPKWPERQTRIFTIYTERGEREMNREERERYTKKERERGTHSFTADVDLVHAICHWDQQLDAKLLVCHIHIWHNLTAWKRLADSNEDRLADSNEDRLKSTRAK